MSTAAKNMRAASKSTGAGDKRPPGSAAGTKPGGKNANTAAAPARKGAATLREAKEALTRLHVLEAAEGVFAEHGYTRTKMQLIARQAGVSLTTLYQFYAGKQELYRAVLLERGQEMLAEVMRQPLATGEQDPSVMVLLRMMRPHVLYLLKHPDYLRMILQQGHAWSHSAAQPTDAEKSLWDQGLRLMSAAFRHCMQAGEMVPGDPEQQAHLLMALQQARLAAWVDGGMQIPDDELLAGLQADFVRLFCRPALAMRLLDEQGGALKVPLDEVIDPAAV